MEVENFEPEDNKQDWFDELSSSQKQGIEQSLADLSAGNLSATMKFAEK